MPALASSLTAESNCRLWRVWDLCFVFKFSLSRKWTTFDYIDAVRLTPCVKANQLLSWSIVSTLFFRGVRNASISEPI